MFRKSHSARYEPQAKRRSREEKRRVFLFSFGATISFPQKEERKRKGVKRVPQRRQPTTTSRPFFPSVRTHFEGNRRRRQSCGVSFFPASKTSDMRTGPKKREKFDETFCIPINYKRCQKFVFCVSAGPYQQLQKIAQSLVKWRI